MRHKFSPLYILMATVMLLSSCLSNDDEDDTTYYEDTAISGFTLGTLKVYHQTKAHDGVTDSTYTTSLTGSNYKFYIDQNNATIYNTDSLPKGTDAAHVLATITTVNGGNAVLNLRSSNGQDSLAYYSSTDSIDFTNPVRVRVYNMRLTAYREYTISVNVHKETADSFAWKATTTDGMDTLTNRRFVSYNGTTYLLNDNNEGYRLTDTGWNPVTLTHLSNIPSKDIFYGGNNEYIITKDSITSMSLEGGPVVKEAIDADASNLPETDVNLIAKKSDINSDTYNLILIGNRDGHTVVWSKVEEKDNANNVWAFYNYDSYNRKTLPYLNNLRAVAYNGGILATGGDFSKMYFSQDNGLTWEVNSAFVLPESFGNTPAHFSFYVDSNNIMYISKDGSNQIWSGRLAALGWANNKKVFTE